MLSLLPSQPMFPPRALNALLSSVVCAALSMFTATKASATTPSAPAISYQRHPDNQRTLLFMNNPEFLWANRDACDLADSFTSAGEHSCSTSLFQIQSLSSGRYRAWWEHRNMMSFAIRSAILLSNTSESPALIELEGDAIEVNSKRRGGNEFVSLFNATAAPRIIKIPPGERILLGDTSQKKILPGHFFAGVSDFNILSGRVTLDEVVFKRVPTTTLKPLGFSDRTIWGVHESLVYKGISSVSAVRLVGAAFVLDDSTPAGALPVTFPKTTIKNEDHSVGFCSSENQPVCQGNALLRPAEAAEETYWITHIAPDPRDANPKRKMALVDDLIELVVPGSGSECPSQWPLPERVAQDSCFRMSAGLHWYLRDFGHWRLPNWGNWAVVYEHPVRIKNEGQRDRWVELRITADGPSPIAWRGDGVAESWQQAFLDPRSADSGRGQTVLARKRIPAGQTEELKAEFVLSGPGAGTLRHHVEIID